MHTPISSDAVIDDLQFEDKLNKLENLTEQKDGDINSLESQKMILKMIKEARSKARTEPHSADQLRSKIEDL